ncbi:MAG: (Fe-S)-binding protein [candidate division NC10 bacterium]|nr:(Fe-S)-binding protein [candidate division NC10 bacterium]
MGPKSVALFATCLVDLFYPQVGEATVRLLRRLGVRVTYPANQTCCGQPLFNNGFHEEAARVARQTIALLEPAECIVVPSGSCACMLKKESLHLFQDDPEMLERAAGLGRKTYELSDFLVRVLGREDVGARFPGTATYHPSCHLLRGLGIADAPTRLLQRVQGLTLRELPAAENCCGFGGSFAVKFPEVSNAILQEKIRNIRSSGAEILVANDCGCLMHMGGGIRRTPQPIRTMHLAEILAGDATTDTHR